MGCGRLTLRWKVSLVGSQTAQWIMAEEKANMQRIVASEVVRSQESRHATAPFVVAFKPLASYAPIVSMDAGDSLQEANRR